MTLLLASAPMRNPDYTEAAEVLTYLCAWLRGRFSGHRPRHACRWWRRSTVERSARSAEAQRLGVVAWTQSAEYERLNLPRFGVFEFVPEPSLPAPQTPPTYALVPSWRRGTTEIPVAQVGELVAR